MHKVRVAKIFLENADGKILLLRRSKTAPRRALEWDLPGGWVEDGEVPEFAAIRELEEEAGIRSNAVNKVLQTSEIRDDETIVRYYFKALSNEPVITLSYEHDQFLWVSQDQFARTMRYEPHIRAFTAIYDK